jgi:hypothetical protein
VSGSLLEATCHTYRRVGLMEPLRPSIVSERGFVGQRARQAGRGISRQVLTVSMARASAMTGSEKQTFYAGLLARSCPASGHRDRSQVDGYVLESLRREPLRLVQRRGARSKHRRTHRAPVGHRGRAPGMVSAAISKRGSHPTAMVVCARVGTAIAPATITLWRAGVRAATPVRLRTLSPR